VKEADWQTFDQRMMARCDSGRRWILCLGKIRAQGQSALAVCGTAVAQAAGVLFKDGTDRHFHAVITNEKNGAGALLEWHREGWDG
jgi:hypothetical protein